MGRRSKSTAKTGDGALYKQQASASQKKKKKGYNITTDDDANDGMYDKVDRYHNHLEQDEIQFDEPTAGVEEEEKEAVFDLGLGASSDEDDDDDDDDSGEDPIASDASGSASEEDNAASSEEEDTDDEQITTLKSELQNTNSNSDILNWGSKKRDYYMADTANRQQDGKNSGGNGAGGKGDDSDSDAEMEEEAGREIQKARYATMDEDDFLPDGVAPAPSKTKPQTSVTAAVPSPNTKTNPNRSREETMEQLERDNPEFLPLVQHFSKVGVQELTERLLIVSKQLSDWKQAQTVGTSTNGLRYLYQKKMVCLSTTLNLIMYLLLKMEADEQYRKQLHDTNTQFNDDDDAATNHTIAYDSLSFNVRSHPVITRLNELNDVASKLKQEVEEPCGLSEQLNSLVQASALMEGGDLSEDETDQDDDDDSKDVTDSGESASEEGTNDNTHSRRDAAVIETTEVDEYVPPHNIRHEARFAVRADDIDHTNSKQALRVPTSDDFGDDDGPADRTAATNLSATMNRISQKGKERTKARVKKSEDEKEGPTLQFQRGLDMMDEMLGPPSDEDGDEEDADEDQPDDDFYTAAKRRSEKKKAERHEAYAVAPKFPRFEGTVEGERAVGYQIMKNRGLVPHQKKANKNPRVRKREQYRKAVIRRKGAVRDIRTGEAVTYGGEDTGIKTGISRSRKLGKLS